MLVAFINSIDANTTCTRMGLCKAAWAAVRPVPLPAPLMAPVAALHALMSHADNTCDHCRVCVGACMICMLSLPGLWGVYVWGGE